MKTAACDPEAFYPLRNLVSGPLDTLDDLAAIERFVRTVVLHDEMVMGYTPLSYEREVDFELTDEEQQAGGRLVVTALAPITTGYDFLNELYRSSPVPEIELTPSLIDVASRYSNAGEGNVYFEAHVEYLKRMLAVAMDGGSVLLCGNFGQDAISTAAEYPEAMFQHLDEDWKKYARFAEETGLQFLVPPVLGIVLTRCARRDAIPKVVQDLRDEWSGARGKVWDLLDALRACRTIGEATEIQKELVDAGRQFSPEPSEFDTRPVRVLWDILAGGVAGGGIAAVTGMNPIASAVTGAITQATRTVPAFAHEFGSMLFGRGAFDLARRVRRETSKVEFESLSRLLTDAEKGKLGCS